jgi:hexosaminidase
MTRVVDAARPDAKAARVFRKDVDAWLENKNENLAASLKKWLLLWQENHSALVELVAQSPVLAEIASLSDDLMKIAGTGLQAMAKIEIGEKAGEAWLARANAAIAKAKEPRGQTELMVVSAIEKLVQEVE